MVSCNLSDVVKKGFVYVKKPKYSPSLISYLDKFTAWKRRYVVLEDAVHESNGISKLKIFDSDSDIEHKNFTLNLDSLLRIETYSGSSKFEYALILTSKNQYVRPILIGLKTYIEFKDWQIALFRMFEKTLPSLKPTTPAIGGVGDWDHMTSRSVRNHGYVALESEVKPEVGQSDPLIYDMSEAPPSGQIPHSEQYTSGKNEVNASKNKNQTNYGYLELEDVSPTSSVQLEHPNKLNLLPWNKSLDCKQNSAMSSMSSVYSVTGDQLYEVEALASRLSPGHDLDGPCLLHLDPAMSMMVVRHRTSGAVQAVLANVASVKVVGSSGDLGQSTDQRCRLEVYTERNNTGEVLVYEFITKFAAQILHEWNGANVRSKCWSFYS